MSKTVLKKCKGINRAKNMKGCGDYSSNRRYGLCPICLYDWAIMTDEGAQWLESQKLKKRKNQVKEKRKKLKEQKLSNMSVSQYRSNIIQPKINEIARLIDADMGCIATHRRTGKMNGGHRWSVGSNSTLALNLHNIHKQSFKSNHWNSGDETAYDEGLVFYYGDAYKEFIYYLRTCPALHLTKEDLKEINKKAISIRRRLRKEIYDRELTPPQRIHLRNEVNKELGIYPDEYGVFKP